MRYKEETSEKIPEKSAFPKRHRYEKFRLRKILLPLGFFTVFLIGIV